MADRSGWLQWIPAIALAFVLTACGGDDDGVMAAGDGDDSGGGHALQVPQPEGARGDAPSAALGQLPSVPADVIKSADITLEVPKDGLTTSVRSAVQVAGRFNGFALSSSVDTESETGTVTLRVPAIAFERALAAIEDLATVTRHDVTGDEVGQQFLDLEARLRNQRAQEAALLGLMQSAATIDDTIRVQDELGIVRLEIERIQGRLRYLRDQTSLATITATFLVGSPPSEKDPGVIAEAWTTARDVALRSLGVLIVVTGFAVPVIVLALVGWLISRAIKVRAALP